jgi:hypothetical protein
MTNLPRLTALVLCAGLALPALAQNEKPGATPAKPATPAAPATPAVPAKPAQPDAKGGDKGDPMAAWNQANQLSKEHIDMATHMVGEWDTATTFWLDPKGQPMTSKGHAKFDTTMGGRFVTQEYHGDMDGKPFKGMGLYAYNTVTKEYENTWIDSSSTGIMLSTGHKNEKGEIVYTGQYDDPMSGQKKTSRSVLRHEGKDKMVFEMFDKGTDGTEFKNLEVVYTRSVPSRMSEPKDKNPKDTAPKLDEKKRGS